MKASDLITWGIVGIGGFFLYEWWKGSSLTGSGNTGNGSPGNTPSNAYTPGPTTGNVNWSGFDMSGYDSFCKLNPGGAFNGYPCPGNPLASGIKSITDASKITAGDMEKQLGLKSGDRVASFGWVTVYNILSGKNIQVQDVMNKIGAAPNGNDYGYTAQEFLDLIRSNGLAGFRLSGLGKLGYEQEFISSMPTLGERIRMVNGGRI